ncbi:MAG TPA: hypothetical protein VKE42_09100 [Candidatus Cybelea sp.]|nr:hypothetical protein [Candidatus Cybelea sp.]
MTQTNAARIAQAAADAEFRREQIMGRAIDALATSIESIKADDSCTNKREVINESLEQCRQWLAKNLPPEHDDGDDDDEKIRNMARLEREGEDDGDDDDGDDGERAVEHHASKVADLLTESKSFPSREVALRYLLHHKDGQALLHRMRKGANMAKKDTWQSIAKEYGVIAVAKMIADDGDAHGLGEAELTQLATEHAVKAYPGKKPDAAFAALYSESLDLRKALQIAKLTLADIVPVFVGGEAARSPNDPKDALGQLNELVAKQRERHPEMTPAQAFARVYADNPELARREREENTPRGHPSYR